MWAGVWNIGVGVEIEVLRRVARKGLRVGVGGGLLDRVLREPAMGVSGGRGPAGAKALRHRGAAMFKKLPGGHEFGVE